MYPQLLFQIKYLTLIGMELTFVRSWSIYPNPWNHSSHSFLTITDQRIVRKPNLVTLKDVNPFINRRQNIESLRWKRWKRTDTKKFKDIPENPKQELKTKLLDRFYVWNGDLNWQVNEGSRSRMNDRMSEDVSREQHIWDSESQLHKEDLNKSPEYFKKDKLQKMTYARHIVQNHGNSLNPYRQYGSRNDDHPIRTGYFYRHNRRGEDTNHVILGRHRCMPPDLSTDPCLSRQLTIGNSGDVGLPLQCNRQITRREWLDRPRIMFPRANPSRTYCLIMVDPDAPSPHNNYMGYWLHYLVTNIAGYNILWGDLIGNVVAEFKQPDPPEGTHRYQFYLFEQKCSELKFPGDFDLEEREKFPLESFVKMNDFCQPEAAFQYRVAPLTKN